MANLNSAGWLADWISREEVQFEESTGSLLADFLLAQESSEFVFLNPSTDWIKPTHIMEVSLLYSKCAYLKVNLTYKIPSQKYLH